MMPKRRPVTVAKAHYTPSEVAMYAGNPLIEALPPRLGSKLLRQRLTVQPNSPNVGQLSLSEREESIHTLFDIRLLSQQHVDLYYDMYSMIRYGYVHRNSVRAEVVAWSYDIADPSVEQKRGDAAIAKRCVGTDGGRCAILDGLLRQWQVNHDRTSAAQPLSTGD